MRGHGSRRYFLALAIAAALMLAPMAAWVAIRAELAWAPVVLGAAVMLWVAGFDVIYACQDVDFDVKMRLRSVPARFGVAAALHLASATPTLSGANESAYHQLQDDVLAEPLELLGGMMTVPQGPGLGIDVDRAKVEQYSIA